MSARRRHSERHPRILVIGAHLSDRGGHRTPSEDLRDRLAATGDLDVISCSGYRHGVVRLVHTLATIAREWGRTDVALIDVFSGRAFLIAELACAWARRSGAQTILVLHGGGLPDFARTSNGRVQRLLSAADRVTSPSAYLASCFEQVRRVTVIPNAVDLSRFGGPRDTTAEARNASPHLMWIRAFHSIYRPWDAVEVLHRVAESHPGARLTLIGLDKGDGSLQRVHEVARRRKVTGRLDVILGMPHDDIAKALRSADVFLNTTSVDNTPMSVLEALAARVPVVTTDAGGIPHLVQHDESALVSPVAATDAMADHVLRLLEDAACAERLREGGSRVAQAHDWSTVFPRWRTLIRDVISGTSG